MNYNLNLQQRMRKQMNRDLWMDALFGLAIGTWLTMSIYTIFALGGVVIMPEVSTKLFDALIFVWLFFTGVIVVGRIVELQAKKEKEGF